uniref:Reverse transcriptase-rnase h-integrase n=1 Tax=Moniliophthora roreri TaxID=221103 RepID=A0A0W0G5G4_MONRR
MPPPADPREMNGYPRPDINDTRSLVSQLTSEPLVDEVQFPTAAHSTPKPNNTLIYPDPTSDPNVKPKIESIDPAGSL